MSVESAKSEVYWFEVVREEGFSFTKEEWNIIAPQIPPLEDGIWKTIWSHLHG